MTADELVMFYHEHYHDGVTFQAIFGEKTDFASLTAKYSVQEIVKRIQDWKNETDKRQENQKQKE